MPETIKTSPAPNPFDPAALRLDQSFAETVGVRKLLTTVPVRKPNRQDFVRAHADPAYRLTPAAIIELKEARRRKRISAASRRSCSAGRRRLPCSCRRGGIYHRRLSPPCLETAPRLPCLTRSSNSERQGN